MRLLRGLKRIMKWFIGLLLITVIVLYITDFDYILKGVRVVYLTGHTTAYIDDHPYFENSTIEADNTTAQPWMHHKNYNLIQPTSKLLQTNETYGTTAFLVIKNDSIWYENYPLQEYDTSSQTNSFSMAKSIVSALLGKAIKDGFIKSLDQPIGEFFAQYATSKTTVGDLSSMASGLDWEESYKSPFSVTARAYYDDDLAATILNQKVVETPGVYYKYLSGNTQLLAMVLEKATGQKLSQYLSRSFWKPLGMEQDALWQVDDENNLLVKAYCCIASNAKDFARFGRLYKNHGTWNGRSIIDSAFVAKSVQPRFEDSPEYGYGFWLSNHLDKKTFVMRGILGQYVITIPEDDLIIVRLGHQRGERSNRPFTDDFYTYIEEVYHMLAQ